MTKQQIFDSSIREQTQKDSGVSVGSMLSVTRAGSEKSEGHILITGKKRAILFSDPSSESDDFVAESDTAPVQDLASIYPHWESESSSMGLANRYLTQAVKDLDAAATYSLNASFVEYASHLTLAESSLFRVLQCEGFPRPAYSVVSFSAWGIKALSTDEPQPHIVMAISYALKDVTENVFLDMQEASLLMVRLEAVGLKDGSPIAKEFEDVLFEITE